MDRGEGPGAPSTWGFAEDADGESGQREGADLRESALGSTVGAATARGTVAGAGSGPGAGAEALEDSGRNVRSVLLGSMGNTELEAGSRHQQER